jgi:hypothetical protein
MLAFIALAATPFALFILVTVAESIAHNRAFAKFKRESV